MDNNNYENNQYENNQPQYHQPPYGQPQYGQPPYGQPQYEEPKKSTLAIVSLVLGIVALLLSCCCSYLSIPLGIAAVVCGAISIKNKEGGKGMAIAGMITGGVGFFFAVLLVVMTFYMQQSGLYDQMLSSYFEMFGIDPKDVPGLY